MPLGIATIRGRLLGGATSVSWRPGRVLELHLMELFVSVRTKDAKKLEVQIEEICSEKMHARKSASFCKLKAFATCFG